MLLDPKPGEVWLVDFEPSVGSEIYKRRPAVVISVSGYTNLPLRIVVPIRGHSDEKRLSWLVPLKKDAKNKLTKDSVVDASQVHSFDLDRFITKIGFLTTSQVLEIRNAVALCIGV